MNETAAAGQQAQQHQRLAGTHELHQAFVGQFIFGRLGTSVFRPTPVREETR